MQRLFAIIVLATTTIACEAPVTQETPTDDSTPQGSEVSASPDEAPALAEPASDAAPDVRFEKLTFTSPPAGVEAVGKLDGGLRWKDAEGESVMLFSTTSEELDINDRMLVTTTMRADRWRKTPTAWELYRSSRQIISRCAEKTRAEVFFDDAWSLTDLDDDGVAEATFAWISRCGEGKPATKKVIITRGEQKIPMRGTTRVETDDGELGGENEPDLVFALESPAFLSHAESVWQKVGD